MDKKKLNAKDFINIGIFTVIYFVMFFITGMMGYIPIFAVIIPLVLGIPGNSVRQLLWVRWSASSAF